MKEYENQLENRLDVVNEDIKKRDAEIIRLKGKISALESELRIRKTREEEKCKKP